MYKIVVAYYRIHKKLEKTHSFSMEKNLENSDMEQVRRLGYKLLTKILEQCCPISVAWLHAHEELHARVSLSVRSGNNGLSVLEVLNVSELCRTALKYIYVLSKP